MVSRFLSRHQRGFWRRRWSTALAIILSLPSWDTFRTPAHSVVPYEFIAAPRGLPVDLSDVLAAWVAKFGEVPHASWLLLRELQEFPWRERHIQKEAMVARRWRLSLPAGTGRFLELSGRR